MGPESHDGASNLPQAHPEHSLEDSSVLQGIHVNPDTKKLVLPPLTGLTKSISSLGSCSIDSRSGSTSRGATIAVPDDVVNVDKSLAESPNTTSTLASLPSVTNTSETVTSSASPRAITCDTKQFPDVAQKLTTSGPTPPESSSPRDNNTTPQTTIASTSTTATSEHNTEVKKCSFNSMVSKVLGMEANELLHWPCTSETLNELLRLKIEQERTKQEQLRGEHSKVTVDFLKLAQSLNLPMELISYMISPANGVEENRYQATHSEPQDVFSKLRSRLTELETYYSANGNRLKRKHGDGHGYLHHDTADTLRSHFISPLRSPDSLPHTMHRRILSESSENSATHASGSNDDRGSPQQQVTKAIPSSGLPSTQPPQTEGDLQQHHHAKGVIILHPSQLQQQHVPGYPYPPYPMYYQGPPPPPIHVPPGTSNETMGSSSKDNSSNYGHNYPGAALYPGGPYGIPSASNPNPHQSQYYPQQQQQQQQQQPLSYFVQGNQVVCVPDQQEPHIIRRSSSSLQPLPKKVKHSHKNNNINFMITTPKNPPARKYNNPKNSST
ncbi:uncharacterized protein KQ657_004075 [Scheffersomyces spartinae]|uniref:Uncharacterized protein n=1 Tax=Scheffersomyces spartinae TaxID=45513 RepID=A0A9P7VCU2_9ASCO|nr:uncharacterized protein KQ657_004075 [Scheffersomyces spartinae]KAG7194964.1 hypothetical protein KQ657_004075 [Scheffersomyces spartinae]